MFRQILVLGMAAFGISAGAMANEAAYAGDLLNQFLHTRSSNCQVRIDSSHTYHQMYVNGAFKGNYLIGSQDAELEYMLYRYVSNGVCRSPGGHENPDGGGLISRFMRGASANCRVSYDSSGTYHQMYVNGAFKGNYVVGTQDAELEYMLRRYISNRVCHMRY